MGMPTIASAAAISKWVPINTATQLPMLADVIRVGDYALIGGRSIYHHRSIYQYVRTLAGYTGRQKILSAPDRQRDRDFSLHR